MRNIFKAFLISIFLLMGTQSQATFPAIYRRGQKEIYRNVLPHVIGLCGHVLKDNKFILLMFVWATTNDKNLYGPLIKIMRAVSNNR